MIDGPPSRWFCDALEGNTLMWTAVDDAERPQWDLVPYESVGPLRFGMSLEDLAAVAVDALRGPQVRVGGVRLIGRVPSQLEEEFVRYAEGRGLEQWCLSESEPQSEELGLLVRVQRAADVLLTRAFFVGDFQDWAYTLHDCVPRAELDFR
ncbi:hypothetical protein [Streptomyces sp. NPDC058751]|uniref:hypothetical protein n=1 Tax=Streptomyces sp. NPDC058751 TaxID=3346623 RepID=UPI0036AB457C